MSPRRSAADARATRERILSLAVDRSSQVGLEGLTIGRMATELQMSKAGVVGPFGTRDHLQSEAIDKAVEVFRDAVIAPAMEVEPGVDRVRALIVAWAEYLADGPFPGGCYITAASSELDGRPGPLRDRLRSIVRQWRDFLVTEIRHAQTEDGMAADRNPEDLATTVIGISMAINQEVQLLEDPSAGQRAQRSMMAAVRLGE